MRCELTRGRWMAAVAVSVFCWSLHAECPKKSVRLPSARIQGSTFQLRWNPPEDAPPGVTYEILSSEHGSTSKSYCAFFTGPDQEHVIATTTETSFDYHAPLGEVFEFAVQVQDCPETHSLAWYADTFDTPDAPEVVDVDVDDGTVAFTFTQTDVRTHEVILGRVDPSGEAPDFFPLEVFPTFTGFSNGATNQVGWCPAGKQVTVQDGRTPATPDPLPPGAYSYWLVSYNFGFGRAPGSNQNPSDPICVNVDCPACNCDSTVQVVDAACADAADTDCDGGIPADLRQLFSAAPRSRIAADGVSELVVFQAASSPGPVTFTIETLQGPVSGGAYGTLHAIGGGGGGGSSIEVEPQLSIGHLRYAFARYRAPVDLPANRRFWIAADVPSRKPLPPSDWLHAPVPSAILSLEPVPVVLVHGVWSSPRVWTGMRQYLRERLFPVCEECLADYGDAASENPNNAPSFDPLAGDSAVVMDAIDQAVRGALRTYRRSGMAVSRVDAVGHSMGGLVLRARTVYPRRAYRNAFHKIITIGTPHHGTPLADWLLEHKCDRLRLLGRTIEEQLAQMQKPLGPAIAQFQTGSPTLRRLGTASVPSHAIAGIAPPAITDLEDTLNLLAWLSGNDVGVEGIMSAAGVHEHDVIVPAASQRGGIRGAVDVPGVVHARVNAGAPDVAETDSPAVWARVEEALRASVDSPLFARFELPPPAGTPARENVPCPAPVEPPAEEAGALSVPPGTIVHPGDRLEVSFTPARPFERCLLTIGDSACALEDACTATWTVPARGGRVEVRATTPNAHASSHVLVQPASPPTSLDVRPSSLAFDELGATARLTATARSAEEAVDVTAATAGTTYTTRDGNVSVSASGVVTAVAPGNDVVTVAHGELTRSIAVKVAITNHAPRFAPLSRYVVAPNTTATIPLRATDEDGDALAFTALQLPSFATLVDDRAGIIAVEPSEVDAGAYDAVVAVSDGALGAVARFTIVVGDETKTRRRSVRH